MLDGLEVTIVGTLGPRLQQANSFHLSASEFGLTASLYLVGAVVGALLFGFLTDKLRRGSRRERAITMIPCAYLDGLIAELGAMHLAGMQAVPRQFLPPLVAVNRLLPAGVE